jgi:hypothetical protein
MIRDSDGWISVNDCLPDRSGDFEVYLSNNTITTSRYNYRIFRWNSYWSEERFMINSVVVAWRILNEGGKV